MTYEIDMTAAEEARAIEMIPGLAAQIEHLTALVEAMASRLPPTLRPAIDVAREAHLDVRTLVTRHPDSIVRFGRRLMCDASKLRPATREQISQAARAARGAA